MKIKLIKLSNLLRNHDYAVRRGVFLIIALKKEGTYLAREILYNVCDQQTILFLSGGSTPKFLYDLLAREKKLSLGAAAMVDERFGLANHKNSNERMVRETGLLHYFEEKKIPFHPILKLQFKSMFSLVMEYEKDIKRLLSNFPKKVAIMGIGEDGHIAGLSAKSQISSIRQAQDDPEFIEGSNLKSQIYVVGIRNFAGEFKKRITLTFKALSRMDLLIILVFGKKKRKALSLMFGKGSFRKTAARFYVQSEIAKKTILITDQKL